MTDQNRPDGAGEDAYVIEDNDDSIESIEQEMKAAAEQAAAGAPPAEQARDDFKDRYLRTLADFDNFRKRADREKQDFRKYAVAETIRDLLPVLDNFDRALDHAAEGDDFHKGVLLIYKQLYDVLQRHGLKPIEESGVHFDPNIHEAVVREEDASVPSHTVTAILQKGYFLHDRLLRPAMVKVAVGGAEAGG